MSRSNPRGARLETPCRDWFQWEGKKTNGYVRRYNKDTKESTQVKLPFVFLVLEQLATITGWCKPDDQGYFGNEVFNITRDLIEVRTKAGGKKATGLYSVLVKEVKGLKYAKSVYIAFRDDDGTLKLGNFQFAGSSMGPWIELADKHNMETGCLKITGKVEKKEGDNDYLAPVMSWQEKVEPDTEAQAIELDKTLQEYLKLYFADGLNPGSDVSEAPGKQGDYGARENPGIADVVDDPIAKSLSDLVSAKQLGMIRALTREKGLEADNECTSVLGCKTDELSKRAASAFIGYLQNAESGPGNDMDQTAPTIKPEEEDIPF